MNEPPEIIGSSEAAEILGVSLRTAQRVLKHASETGEIPIIYESNRGERLVTRESVQRYANKTS